MDTAEHRLAHRPTVERVIAAMRTPEPQVLRLGDMADLACLSPFHFGRVFRAVTGLPPGEFQAALRLDRAKRLLLGSDLSVTEVCFEIGYESLGAFTTRFTRLVGVTPGRFRRLPELAAPALDGLAASEPVSLPPVRLPPGIAGRIIAPDGTVGVAFVGLFPTAIARGRPVAGTVVPAPGPYEIDGVPDGRYHVLAAVLPATCPATAYLMPGTGALVGSGPGPVTVRNGRAAAPVHIVLRPPLLIDPPILVALPALLLDPPSPAPGSDRRKRKIREAPPGPLP